MQPDRSQPTSRGRIDVDAIKSRCTVPAILAAHGHRLGRRGPCPIHGGDNRTAFAHGDEWWHCHTRCGGGDVIKLVQLLRNCTFREAATWLGSFAGLLPYENVTEIEIDTFPDISVPARESMLADIAERWHRLVDQRDELDQQIDEADLEWRQARGSSGAVVAAMLGALTEPSR